MHVQSERVDMYYVRSQLAYGQPVSRQKKKDMHVLLPFINIRYFSFVKQIYLDTF
jgi:hypothetical protein